MYSHSPLSNSFCQACHSFHRKPSSDSLNNPKFAGPNDPTPNPSCRRQSLRLWFAPRSSSRRGRRVSVVLGFRLDHLLGLGLRMFASRCRCFSVPVRLKACSKHPSLVTLHVHPSIISQQHPWFLMGRCELQNELSPSAIARACMKCMKNAEMWRMAWPTRASGKQPASAQLQPACSRS